MKIVNGQAEVIGERCIACGNCVKVCSQGAKAFHESIGDVRGLLDSGPDVIACVAPSFPAEFSELPDSRYFVGMLRKLGFNKVVEVAFGADLVANTYKNVIKENEDKTYISSDCPAIVYYIKHYHPDLIPLLAPVVSPIIAISRVVKKAYGTNNKIVFIGPCIAKKAETPEVDEVLTFSELRIMLQEDGIDYQDLEPVDFDPPKAGKGVIFPVSRGLLENIACSDDIIQGNVFVAEGRAKFQEAIDELERGGIQNRHLELLCCDGCIMGAGMSKKGKRFERKHKISQYAHERMEDILISNWQNQIDKFSKIDLSISFEAADRRFSKPSEDELQEVLEKMGKFTEADHLNCGACGYHSCTEHAIAILEGLAEDEMCLPYTIEKLHKSIEELNLSNEKLASTKEALKQSEKLAGMGQLSAGIAHELNNPLGVISLHSNILKDKTNESDPSKESLELIVEHADRCKKIVKGLLNFARKNQVKLQELNIEDLVKHSFDSIIIPDNVELNFVTNLNKTTISVDPDQIMQVLINLEKNAIEAMPSGGTLTVSIEGTEKHLKITMTKDRPNIIFIITDQQRFVVYAFEGETGFIDLSPLVRELSLLESPMQPLCQPDCQGLCMVCGQNLNEADCGCEVDEIDPRLAKLRSLLE
jgi:iron only hydrogenase large subunit-like protein/nitrogen-specific signal transduction histidine kinase